jgi:uncharacterized protein YbjT (DUF2867 family)
VKRVLVVGATGRVGREVVRELCAAGAFVRALARNPDACSFLPQVEVVRGDLTVPESLEGALDGVDAVFLVWVAPPATIDPAVERMSKHVRRIVFVSAPLKTAHPFFQQPNPTRMLHAAVERAIETSGIDWTFLRPGIFAANALHFWGPQIRAGNVVRWPYLGAPTAPVDERDIAAVAVRTLCDDGHAGAEYVLTGPDSLTQFEQISTIGRAIGRNLRIEEISPDEARRGVLAPWPATVAEMLLAAWAAAVGRPAFLTSTVEEVAGSPARTFAEWAADHARQFRIEP